MGNDGAVTRIHVDGYRSIRGADLAPGRVTVLIGPNGSGKSNLLAALRTVALMRTQSLRRFVGESGGASALLHYGPQVTREIGFEVEFGTANDMHAYVARLGYTAGDSFQFLDERVKRGAHPGVSLGAGHAESRLDEPMNGEADIVAREVTARLSRIGFYHFHDTSLSSPLRTNARQADDQVLHSDGSNLAAFLWRLSRSQEHASSWRMIGLALRQVAPYVKRLDPALVDPSRPETSAVRLYWVDERDHRFDVHDLSDGTLRALALITALHQPSTTLPSFVTIDEPELGLHPAAITLFAGMVRSVSHRCQVLLATQSKALLDEFNADEVVVAERHDAATRLTRLDAARLRDWLEEYSLSELYDKNVLGGRP